MEVRSHIGVKNKKKILFDADKGRSHKTSQSHNRGSLVAGTTVLIELIEVRDGIKQCDVFSREHLI